MLEIDSTGLMIFGFDWKIRCVFTSWFEAVVEVVMEKPVPPAKLKLIPLNLVSKNVLSFLIGT